MRPRWAKKPVFEEWPADVGRRVIPCVTCARVAAWHGEETTRLAGWHSKAVERGGTIVRVWVCADCWVPAPTVASPARHRLPPYLEHLILKGEEKVALEQLEIVRLDSERFAVYLDAIANLVALHFTGKRRPVVATRNRWLVYLKAARRTLPRVAPGELLKRLTPVL